LQHVISLQQYKKHAAMFCKTQTKPKVSEKKGATGQSFIRKGITCYRIGTLGLIHTSHRCRSFFENRKVSIVRLGIRMCFLAAVQRGNGISVSFFTKKKCAQMTKYVERIYMSARFMDCE
jgi:hypothetical protein